MDVIRDMRTEMVRQRIDFTQLLEEQQEEIAYLREEIEIINAQRAKDKEFTGHF